MQMKKKHREPLNVCPPETFYLEAFMWEGILWAKWIAKTLQSQYNQQPGDNSHQKTSSLHSDKKDAAQIGTYKNKLLNTSGAQVV